MRLLDAGLREGPAAMRAAVLRTQETADCLSGDRLQVFAELVQNADDAGARRMRFRVGPDALAVAHDGRGVGLGDVLLMALPGLSGKAQDPDATGRFGIGLATVRALSRVWEVHSPPYRVRFDGIGIGVAEQLDAGADGFANGLASEGWTVFRVPLAGVALSEGEVARWFERWDDGALLFLRNLREVRVEGVAGELRTLRLRWSSAGSRVRMRVGAHDTEVCIRRAETSTGAAWRVYDAELPCPEGLLRRHKAEGPTVPVAVALPVAPGAEGMVHAALPMAALDVPVRVHAQFDPLVSRRDFVASAWNDAMAGCVADLWAAAVPGVLGGDGPAAWHLIPGETPAGAPVATALADALRTALVERARTEVAARLRLACPDGVRRPIAELAVEERRLTGVLGPAQTARLAELPAAFPPASRDRAGRWRRVLADWRTAGSAPIPEEVTARCALGLFTARGAGNRGADTDGPAIGVDQGIRLAAVAVQAGLDAELRALPWVADRHGVRREPPSAASGLVLVRRTSRPGLAHRLGTAVDLHPLHHTDTAAARTVLAWLDAEGCLADADDTDAVLRRAGGGAYILGDDGTGCTATAQLLALHEALAAVGESDRRELGPVAGRAVRLRTTDGTAAPEDAYLSAELEPGETHPFAFAAYDTPALTWLHPAYADLPIGSAADRAAFLKVLGAADAPRLVRPRAVGKVYTGDRCSLPGLPAEGWCGTPARTRELRRLGADHTLDDHDSPDLAAVAASIAADPDRERRRRRAVALVHTLARAHGRRAFTVEAAYGYYGWHRKGRTAPLWIWRVRDVAWLERADGTPARPGELHLPTPASAALFGDEDPGYLHPGIHEATRVHADTLVALGLTGDPGAEDLVARLRELRRRTGARSPGDRPGTPFDAVVADAVAVYRAFAVLLGSGHRRTDTERTLRAAAREPFVLTDLGWRRPAEVLCGPSILGGYRAFVPPEPGLSVLWDALGVREPVEDDLAAVLHEAAVDTSRPEEERLGVTLEALRRLALLLGDGRTPSPASAATLSTLPLRVRGGWTARRPVYALDNRHLAGALSRHVPVWQPGGDLQQFAALLAPRDGPDTAAGCNPLRVTRVEPLDAVVLDGSRSAAAPALTTAYRRAIARLRDTLVRDEPEAAAACTDWSRLSALEVRVLPTPRIALPLTGDGATMVELPTDAHADAHRGVLYIASAEALETTRGAGQAVAAWFTRERTRVGHVWRDVWEHEHARTDGPENTAKAAPLLPSARARDDAKARRIEHLLRTRTEGGVANSAPTQPSSPASPPPVPAPAPDSVDAGPPRTPAPRTPPRMPQRHLVDPATLPEPTTIPSAGSGEAPASDAAMTRPRTDRPGGATDGLPAPLASAVPPQQHSGAPAYTPQERESTAYELLRMVLARQGISLSDHRAQAGLGADAVDSLGQFYEIKAHAGAEPREVTLTVAEFERALVAGERFSLVVAANLEAGAGIPRLRIITDPLRHLGVERSQVIRVTGLHETADAAIVHEWRPPGPESPGPESPGPEFPGPESPGDETAAEVDA